MATATDSTTVPTEISIEFTNDEPMLAPSHARRNASRLAVVGRPICEFAQSRFVRNAFDAITYSGKNADALSSSMPMISGHRCAAGSRISRPVVPRSFIPSSGSARGSGRARAAW